VTAGEARAAAAGAGAGAVVVGGGPLPAGVVSAVPLDLLLSEDQPLLLSPSGPAPRLLRARPAALLDESEFEAPKRLGEREGEEALMVVEPQQRPWCGYLILLGCIAGIIVSILWPGGIADVSVNPMIGPTAAALVATGAKVSALIICGDSWRLISPIWLHAGLVHIALNMNMLIRMGWPLERAIGTPRFAALYIASGVFSMVGSAVFATTSITVGASGALFGVLGAMLGELIINCHLLTCKERVWNLLGISLTIAINLALGLMPFLDNFAHIFGCLSGLLLGLGLIIHPDHRKGGRRFRQFVLGFLALAVWVFLFVVGIVWLVYNIDANALCPNCRYLSCVPTPWWTCSPIPAILSQCFGNVSNVR
jgi:membrane associated rhomboid family serine protease